jgi:hypothetical protein
MLRESAKLLVRLGRLERPLNALSTHSLCQLGYRRAEGCATIAAAKEWRTRQDSNLR